MNVETALKNLIDFVKSGERYEHRNPYLVPEVKDAVTALAEAETRKPRIESLRIVWDVDCDADMSWLKDELDSDDLTDDQKNAAQKRLDQFYCGDAWFEGCYAEATVSYPIGNHPCEHRRLESFKSGGLWGIESDSGDDYKKDIEAEELSGLKHHLEHYGISVQNFDSIEVAESH